MPNLTDVAPVRLVPVMVTVVPPPVEPLVGVKLVMVGPGTANVKLAVEVAVPPGVVTEILTAPAGCALVLAMTLVVPVTRKVVAAVVPNLTAVAPARLVPMMVTVVPPEVVPLVGVKLVMAGGTTNVKFVEEVPVPPTVLTEILTVPAPCALVLAMILVDPVTRKVVAGVVPNVTDVAPVKLLPVMVTVVPPEVEPLVGVKLVMTGGATNTKYADEVAVPEGVVTLILSLPAESALVLAKILVVPVTWKVVAVVAPNLTEVAPFRLVPMMVTVVPPEVGPLVGVKLVMVGRVVDTNLKNADDIAVPDGVLTEILTVPAPCDLVTALIFVAVVTV